MSAEQRAERMARDLPAWARPIWLRYGLRLINNVPKEKATALFWREIEAARP